MEQYYRDPERLEEMLRFAISQLKSHRGTIKPGKQLEFELLRMPADYKVEKRQRIELPRADLPTQDC
jgi:hypothetical protein